MSWPEDEIGIGRYKPRKEVHAPSEHGKILLPVDGKTQILVSKKLSVDEKMEKIEKYLIHMYGPKEAIDMIARKRSELTQKHREDARKRNDSVESADEHIPADQE